MRILRHVKQDFEVASTECCMLLCSTTEVLLAISIFFCGQFLFCCGQFLQRKALLAGITGELLPLKLTGRKLA
jgi:hypothetical protein